MSQPAGISSICRRLKGSAPESFALSVADVSDRFRIPHKLYGRKKELGALTRAFDRVLERGFELVMVEGFSGIGKSSLIRGMKEPVLQRGGRFVEGKCEQFSRHIPYSAVSQSFTQLIRQILVAEDSEVRRFRRRILDVLGPNGQVAIEVIPNLETLIGMQPAVPPLPALESQNRLHIVLDCLLGVLAQSESPIVMFLDDLQWADQATFRLLSFIATRSSVNYVLVIGAYRSNEVSATHPILGALRQIEEEGGAWLSVALGSLFTEDIVELLADTLGQSASRPAALRELAELARVKTGGNPFFLRELLEHLHVRGLLSFDLFQGSWTWDMGQVERTQLTDNVAALMVDKLAGLPEETQRVLYLAASLGSTFDLRTLATVSEGEIQDTHRKLWPSAEMGLVVAIGTGRYQFQHDRVQQAAYSLIPPEEKSAVHYRIGKLLLDSLLQEELEERELEVVDHLNKGLSLIQLAEDRETTARMNLRAGCKAKASAAYASASHYFRSGIALLGSEAWSRDDSLFFDLHLGGAECEYLAGSYDEADVLFKEIFARFPDPLTRAPVYEIQIAVLANQGKAKESVLLAIEALRMFGLKVPFKPSKVALLLEIIKANFGLRGRRIEDLLDAPTLDDPKILAVVRIIQATIAPSFFVSPDLFGFIIMKMVNISLRKGNTRVTAFAYVCYGFLLAGMRGDPDKLYRFGRLGINLADKFSNPDLLAKVNFIYAAFVHHYSNPLKDSYSWLKRAEEAGFELGDFVYLGFAVVHLGENMFVRGASLALLEEQLPSQLERAKSTHYQEVVDILYVLQQTVRGLRGHNDDPSRLASADYDEDAQLEVFEKERSLETPWAFFFLRRGMLLFFFGRYEQAVLSFWTLNKKIEEVLFGHVHLVEHYYYYSLSLAAGAKMTGLGFRAKHRLRRNLRKLKKYASLSPLNFQDQYFLVRAELAALEGRHEETVRCFDGAICLARDQGFLHREALGNERAGRYYWSRGLLRTAEYHLDDALRAYDRWGASAKVDSLRKEFAGLLFKRSRNEGLLTTDRRSKPSESIDPLAILKASQALSGEIVFEKLVHRLMGLIIATAGAERGALVLIRRGGLSCVARRGPKGESFYFRDPKPVEETDLPSRVIQYVARTEEGVVLENACAEGLFRKDPMVMARQIQSILCVPLIHQGVLKGVIYLENDLVTGAFFPENFEVLSFLAAQMVVSMENASLYSELEDKVEERTSALREAQSRVLRLEREHTELQMAGGFAHEMRNALGGANTLLSRVLGPPDEDDSSLCVESSRALKSVFVTVREHLPDDLTRRIASQVQDINRNQKIVHEALGGVSRSTERALAITAQITDYARLGREVRGRERVDLCEIIRTVVEELEWEAGQIEVQLQMPASAVLLGSTEHFYSMAKNLVLNGRDALFDMAQTRARRLILRIEGDEDDGYDLCVLDNGSGIQEDAREHVFEPFFSTKVGGTGLGLGMVRKLARLYQGTVQFRSGAQWGTMFKLSFPPL